MKKISMWEAEIELPIKEVKKLEKLGLEWIKKDKKALASYAAERILSMIPSMHEKGKKSTKDVKVLSPSRKDG
jgi:hypothetical protein